MELNNNNQNDNQNSNNNNNNNNDNQNNNNNQNNNQNNNNNNNSDTTRFIKEVGVGILKLFIYYPLTRIELLVNALPSTLSEIQVFNKIRREDGLKASTTRGFLFYFGNNFLHSILETQIPTIENKYLSCLVSYASTSPFWFFSSMVSIAPMNYPLRKVFTHNYFKVNILKSFGYYFLLNMAQSLISTIPDLLEDYCEKNPDSKVRYFRTIRDNLVLRHVTAAVVLCPIFCVAVQYPYAVITSVARGLPVPAPVNPISMATNLVNQFGFFKLYASFRVNLTKNIYNTLFQE